MLLTAKYAKACAKVAKKTFAIFAAPLRALRSKALFLTFYLNRWMSSSASF